MPKAKAPEPVSVEAAAENLEIIERFDPAEKAEIDGDPCFDAQLKDDSIPSDLVPCWVHTRDERTYQGRGWRRAVAGQDGIQMLNDLQFPIGAPMTFEDHTLYVRDRARHERVTAAERKRNRDTRASFIKSSNGSIHVNNPGDGPRAMARR